MADEAKDPKAPPTKAEVEQKKVDHDKLVAESMKAERMARAGQSPTSANYGPFADHPARFVVLHELVDDFPAGSEVSYRDLMIWNAKAGGGPDYGSPDVTATKNNVDRLIALEAIEKKKILVEA